MALGNKKRAFQPQAVQGALQPRSLQSSPLPSPSSVWPVHFPPPRPVSHPASHTTVHPTGSHPFRQQQQVALAPQLPGSRSTSHQSSKQPLTSITQSLGQAGSEGGAAQAGSAPQPPRSDLVGQLAHTEPVVEQIAEPGSEGAAAPAGSDLQADGERDSWDTAILNERSDQPACSSTPTEADDSRPFSIGRVLTLRRSYKRRKQRSDQPAEADDSQPLAKRKALKVRRSSNQRKETGKRRKCSTRNIQSAGASAAPLIRHTAQGEAAGVVLQDIAEAGSGGEVVVHETGSGGEDRETRSDGDVVVQEPDNGGEIVVQDIPEAGSGEEDQKIENTIQERSDQPTCSSTPETNDSPLLAITNRLRNEVRNRIGQSGIPIREESRHLAFHTLTAVSELLSAAGNQEEVPERLVIQALAAVGELLTAPGNQEDPSFRLSILVNMCYIMKNILG
ncbi:uncharacterized protein LOC119775846 [Cyprinodon tularosa]|uniref:uncharacterized protein LOC119775846 n=1 Tax=Cyprinodon tularosa TaxID=77115 RepID=UPI0018E209F9|nr:uncharacterized protein LOC119775846 [Cyprinodon tularosa]